jgi:hypothetical protein
MTAGSIRVPATGTIHADDGVVVTPDALTRVAERIRDRAPTYFPDAGFAPGSTTVAIERLGETSSYPLFAVRVGEGENARGAIVKFAPVFDENNEGETEYRHLVTMHARLAAIPELRVPRPLDFYDDINALVMERVGGERFSRVILRDAGFFAPRDAAFPLLTAARRCGSWLAAYHDATHVRDASPFSDDFVGQIQQKLAGFGTQGFPDAAAATVMRTVERLHRAGGSRRVPVADQHGDYGPQNVHCGDDHVCVFDLNYHRSAPIYEDVVYYLVTLETMNPFPRQWFFDRRCVRAMREPFLSGYFGDTRFSTEHTLCIEGYYLKALLFRCAKQRRNTAKRGALPLALFDAQRIRHWYPQRLLRQCQLVDRCLSSAGEGVHA